MTTEDTTDHRSGAPAPSFPRASIRAAVATFGDAWPAAFLDPEFRSPSIRAALRDESVMRACAETLRRGRRATMAARAFVGVDVAPYAVRCEDDAHAPRIRFGEYVIADPATPPEAGCDVIVRRRSGARALMTFVHRRDGRAYLLATADAVRLTAIDEGDIEAMHSVTAVVKTAEHATRAIATGEGRAE